MVSSKSVVGRWQIFGFGAYKDVGTGLSSFAYGESVKIVIMHI